MERYSFEFLSSYDGKADYRLYIDGKASGRITATPRTLTLGFGDGSAPSLEQCAAYNAMKKEQLALAAAKYPEYFADALPPIYTPRAAFS